MRSVLLAWFTIALLAWASCAGTSHGQSCATYSTRSSVYHAPSYSYYQGYSAPTYHAPAYKEVKYEPQAYFTRLVAFFPVLDVPTYGAAVYAPPALTTPQTPGAAPAPAAQPQGDLSKIMAALTTIDKAVQLIDKRLTSLEGPVPQQMQKAPQQSQQQPQEGLQPIRETAQQITTNNCAVCHNSTKAGEWGGGFVMVADDGQIDPGLSAKSKLKIIGRVHQNTMPPNDKTEEGRKTLVKLKDAGFDLKKLPPPMTNYQSSVLAAHFTGQTPTDRKNEVSHEKPTQQVFVRSRD